MSISIRELATADGAAARELIAGVLPDSPAATAPPDAATRFLADPASFLFGAYADEQPVGV